MIIHDYLPERKKTFKIIEIIESESAKITSTVDPAAPVHSTRIRVGRSIDGFGLSPRITKEQRLEVELLVQKAFTNLKDDLSGEYFPLAGMKEEVR